MWIYPTMRRGGRMIYALDVHIPTSPALLWKAGCPNLNDNIGCSANMSSIGQTWSTPSVATLKTGGTVGETASPVVVVGGGYDNCEDGAAAASCGANGSIVYVLNAADGTVLQSFTTTGRVPSDVALVDVDHDGIPDFAYVGDTRGNLYRIGFGLSKSAPLQSGNWTATRIAYTNDTSNPRKFLYPPAIVSAFDSAAGQNAIYVALGTGDREQPLITHYPYTTPILNRFYVFVDTLTAATAANLDDTAVMCDFTSGGTCDTATPQTDACGNTVVIPGSGKQGWFMDLDVCGPEAPDGCTKGSKVIGEQTVTSAAIVGGVVAFSTNRAIPPKPNVCAPQGDARGYLVNLFSGSGAICTSDQTCVCGGERSGDFVGGGLPPSPVIATVNVDGVVQTILIGGADKKGGRSSGIQSQIGFSLSPQRRTRMYWRTEGDN